MGVSGRSFARCSIGARPRLAVTRSVIYYAGVAIEDSLSEVAGGSAKVEGGDIGAGQITIFTFPGPKTHQDRWGGTPGT